MALPRVTPGTYNYGAYSNPTPIKYKGGLGEGLAGIAIAGAKVIKAKKEQKEKEEKEQEQNKFIALQSSNEYRKGLMSALPNANEHNIKLINDLTKEVYQNILNYRNQVIDFDTFRINDTKLNGVADKLSNFKNYVLDKAEGAEVDFALIRQTEGDINKWGRDKAFSYGAQGFKLKIDGLGEENKDGTGDYSVSFTHAAIDFDKFKDENDAVDFSLIDSSNSDSYKTIETDLDELFSDKNAFAPTLKYTYTQDAQFFNDSVQKLTPEAGRYAKGIDNGYAIFNPGDKEKFKQEIVLPQINDNVIQMRGMQIYEDILGLGIFDKNNPEHIQAVKNEMADKILSVMPTSFGKIAKDTSRQSAFAEQTAARERRLNAARNTMENISLTDTKTGKSDPMQKEATTGAFPRGLDGILGDFNNTILNRGYRIIRSDGSDKLEKGNYYVERIEGVTATGMKQGKDTTDITSIIKDLQKTNNSQKLVDRLMSLVYEEDPYSRYQI